MFDDKDANDIGCDVASAALEALELSDTWLVPYLTVEFEGKLVTQFIVAALVVIPEAEGPVVIANPCCNVKL